MGLKGKTQFRMAAMAMVGAGRTDGPVSDKEKFERSQRVIDKASIVLRLVDSMIVDGTAESMIEARVAVQVAFNLVAAGIRPGGNRTPEVGEALAAEMLEQEIDNFADEFADLFLEAICKNPNCLRCSRVAKKKKGLTDGGVKLPEPWLLAPTEAEMDEADAATKRINKKLEQAQEAKEKQNVPASPMPS